MARAKTTCVMAVFPRVIQMEARVMALMAYPPAVRCIDVRRIRVSRLVAKVTMFFWSRLAMLLRTLFRMCGRSRPAMLFGARRRMCRWRGTMGRDITMSNSVLTRRMALRGMLAGMFFTMLAEGHPGLEKKRN